MTDKTQDVLLEACEALSKAKHEIMGFYTIKHKEEPHKSVYNYAPFKSVDQTLDRVNRFLERKEALEAKQPEPIHHNGKTYWLDANGWYDIECAPKDGTVIYAFCSKYSGKMRWDEGEWEWVSHKDEGLAIGGYPTHWQPLPKPPESEVV